MKIISSGCPTEKIKAHVTIYNSDILLEAVILGVFKQHACATTIMNLMAPEQFNIEATLLSMILQLQQGESSICHQLFHIGVEGCCRCFEGSHWNVWSACWIVNLQDLFICNLVWHYDFLRKLCLSGWGRSFSSFKRSGRFACTWLAWCIIKWPIQAEYKMVLDRNQKNFPIKMMKQNQTLSTTPLAKLISQVNTNGLESSDRL